VYTYKCSNLEETRRRAQVNAKLEIPRMAGMRNANSEDASPSLLKPLPVIQNLARPIGTVQAAVRKYPGCCALERKSTEAKCQTGGALIPAPETTNHTLLQI